jgi:hypothetical protein
MFPIRQQAMLRKKLVCDFDEFTLNAEFTNIAEQLNALAEGLLRE